MSCKSQDEAQKNKIILVYFGKMNPFTACHAFFIILIFMYLFIKIIFSVICYLLYFFGFKMIFMAFNIFDA